MFWPHLPGLVRHKDRHGMLDRLVVHPTQAGDALDVVIVEEQPPHRIGCLTHARNLQGEHDCRYKRPQTREQQRGEENKNSVHGLISKLLTGITTSSL